jgi:hypothetical protein
MLYNLYGLVWFGSHLIKMSHRNHDVIYQILEHIFLIITDASYALKEGDALICR